MATSYWFNHWIIHSIDSFERLIYSGTKQVPASQCAYYSPYMLQIVLKMTNITFRMVIVCTLGVRQWLSLWMSNLIDSLDSFKRRFINEMMLCLNGDVQRPSCEFIWNNFSWRNRAKSCNTVIFRQCKSLNIKYIYEITHSYMPKICPAVTVMLMTTYTLPRTRLRYDSISLVFCTAKQSLPYDHL